MGSLDDMAESMDLIAVSNSYLPIFCERLEVCSPLGGYSEWVRIMDYLEGVVGRGI